MQFFPPNAMTIPKSVVSLVALAIAGALGFFIARWTGNYTVSAVVERDALGNSTILLVRYDAATGRTWMSPGVLGWMEIPEKRAAMSDKDSRHRP